MINGRNIIQISENSKFLKKCFLHVHIGNTFVLYEIVRYVRSNISGLSHTGHIFGANISVNGKYLKPNNVPFVSGNRLFEKTNPFTST